ncbi:(p)ppGpp synthetase [Desulfuribacillus stibiiarsenatis]|uniref:GTP diphosphokinase n=1 Tax=Desulfuribacillus stibiiarsenatis TaxID=1390249 RepID=A0A1E5L3B2_9FIRM|nr:bifunctional (p)ppGpp synthetase/guanosine-3',5'-bis(diphosphate) 3'-pyrophosphohydrolase [Desulfuribacillus stibiiarsenatis]OEH84574.1 (p)ppGpp synthetase [Desulfuribacillus stibiiarsenatis]
MNIQALLVKIKDYPQQDIERITSAYEEAARAHEGQKRISGEDYIIHPLSVAIITAELKLDAVTIMAALLHDVVEDTPVTTEEIEKKFGKDVAMLVDGVTKLSKIKYQTKEEQQAENLRKMFMAMAKDIRVLLIKLADRLNNIRTLKPLPPEKQKRIAQETLEIFAPLAHRLGISTVKWELEDIAFRYIEPSQYYRIVNLMTQKRRDREQFIDQINLELRTRLDQMEISADISGRPKHIYSIHRKMVSQNKRFDEIYDLLAVRVIVENIKDCYAVLGVVHTIWKPMPGRFKDYIAMPKVNMYQSLHTTVIGPQGKPFEIQIRTLDMHQTAELGIAAHWAYKENKKIHNNNYEQKLGWFKEILDWQHDVGDANEFVENIKYDLYAEDVFVFTPKGDVFELPAGSVPIDFAYRVHTDVGNSTVGAKINGRIVTLDYRLKTGDIIEILTSKQSFGPSRDWLKIAQSSQAKAKIRNWFKKQKRDENIQKGREMLEKELRKLNFEPGDFLGHQQLQEMIKKFNFSHESDLYAAIGYNGISAHQIAMRLTEKQRHDQARDNHLTALLEAKPVLKHKKKQPLGVRVKGVDNLLVRFSKCCSPVPGDDIVGYITKGRGVSVHRLDCPNVQNEENAQRLIPVEWESDVETSYTVELEITGLDRPLLLNEVMQAVSETKTDINAASGKGDRNKRAIILLTISIRNVEHLRTIVERIKRVRDIYTVRRVMQ